jgi:hypothetical protein
MKTSKALLAVLILVIWISGIVIANGFWSTLFAFFIPFWGYYLVIEKILITNSLI